MYALSKNKNTYKIMRTKRRKPKGWIISSKSYMDLKKIANNLMNDIPKVHLKRIDLTNTSSSMESFIKEEIDIDCSLSRNEVMDESIEKSNQQEDIYKDSKEYNNDPDYEVSNDSENSDDESNTSIVSQSFNENEKSNTTNGSLDTPQYSYEGKASCDDTNLIVPKSKTKGLRKKSFCIYCKKLQTKLSRHLENVHKNETEVKKFISLPKGNSKRKAIIETIRKESNFIYNTSSQYNTGELIVSRRSSKVNKPASDFICCPKCKGYYTKNYLRHHFRKCNKHSICRNVMVLARKIQARIHTKACDMVRKEIFPILRDDDVSKVIRYDELMILYANKLSKKLRNRRHDVIRAELRLLGRHLISIKKLNSNITDFASIYQPRHYDSCILAIKNVAQFDPDTNKFKKQLVATRLGFLLKKLGNLLTTEYIKRDDNEGLRNLDDFLKLLEEDKNGTRIDKKAEETVTQEKRHDKIELPSDNLNVLRLMNLYSDFVIENTECIYEQKNVSVE